MKGKEHNPVPFDVLRYVSLIDEMEKKEKARKSVREKE